MTRIYSNCKEALDEELRNVSELGIEVKIKTMQNKIVEDNDDLNTTKECQFETFGISNTDDFEEMHEFFKQRTGIDFNKAWAVAEFEERIADQPVNPGEAFKLRADTWNEFLVDGKFDYTYSERLNPSLKAVIATLKADFGTRQAYLPIFWPEDCHKTHGKNRVPCSLSYQFMIRNGKLDIIYSMRSCDILRFFVSDVYLTIKLQRYVAKELGIAPGYAYYSFASLHAYKREIKNCRAF